MGSQLIVEVNYSVRMAMWKKQIERRPRLQALDTLETSPKHRTDPKGINFYGNAASRVRTAAGPLTAPQCFSLSHSTCPSPPLSSSLTISHSLSLPIFFSVGSLSMKTWSTSESTVSLKSSHCFSCVELCSLLHYLCTAQLLF